jgi:hypothetical protein
MRFDPFAFRPKWLNTIVNSVVVGKMHKEEEHPVSRILFRLYEPAASLMLRWPKTVIAAAVAIVAITIPFYFKLGSEFMPPLNEGSLLFMPVTLPNISINEAKRLVRRLPTLGMVTSWISQAKDLPKSRVAGPWADGSALNHGSYLFNFGSLTETTVDDWISTLKKVGFTQVDHHGGNPSFFTFGDFSLNAEKFPRGWVGYKEIVDKLHRNGIASILHTYALQIHLRPFQDSSVRVHRDSED